MTTLGLSRVAGRPVYLTLVALCATLGVVAACSDATGPANSGDPDIVNIRFNLSRSPDLLVGDKLELNAVGLDAAGNVISCDCKKAFVSDKPTVASVDANGVVTAVAPGSAVVTAKLENASKSITVVVVSGGSLVITPATTSIGVGGAVQFNAVLRDAAGGIVTGKPVLWNSYHPPTATISATGAALGIAVGTATISASTEGLTATAILNVTAASVASVTITPAQASIGVAATTTLNAIVRDGNGNVLPNHLVTWVSSNPAIAAVHVSGNAVQVRGVAAGSATITATCEGKSATANIAVTATGSGSISVAPTSVSLGVGGSAQLTATVRDASGNVVTNAQVSFSSSNADIVRVSESGVITAVAVGHAVITAASGGQSATAPVEVTPARADRVDFHPPSPVCVGQSTQLRATVYDANGNVLTGRNVTFSSSNALIASVTADGLLTGVAAGTANLTASVEGTSATIQVTICVAAVATINLEPVSATVAVGASVQLLATLRDITGNVLSGRPVSFSTSDAAVATVDVNGRVTGVTTGTATISAAAEGKTSTSVVNVVPIPVESVTLHPPTVSPCVGQTTQLTAVVRDTNGNVLTGRTVAFSSSAPLIASVDPNGLVTALAAGTATITASVEGKSATAQINVCLAAVATVDVTPVAATLGIGLELQLAATLRDAAGNLLIGRPVAFSSSNTAIATVDATGRVKGVSAGSVTITATSEGKTGTSAVTVLPAPVETIELHPPSPTVCVGQTTPLSAVLKDAQGNVLTGRTVTFESSNSLIATVDAAGVITGIAAGTATITASAEGKTAAVQVSVCLAAVASITLEPASVTIKVGASTKLTATLRDAVGNILSGRPVTFTSSNATVATVAADGTVLGLTPGTVTITATSEGNTATSLVTVTLL